MTPDTLGESLGLWQVHASQRSGSKASKMAFLGYFWRKIAFSRKFFGVTTNKFSAQNFPRGPPEAMQKESGRYLKPFSKTSFTLELGQGIWTLPFADSSKHSSDFKHWRAEPNQKIYMVSDKQKEPQRAKTGHSFGNRRRILCPFHSPSQHCLHLLHHKSA